MRSVPATAVVPGASTDGTVLTKPEFTAPTPADPKLPLPGEIPTFPGATELPPACAAACLRAAGILDGGGRTTVSGTSAIFPLNLSTWFGLREMFRPA